MPINPFENNVARPSPAKKREPFLQRIGIAEEGDQTKIGTRLLNALVNAGDPRAFQDLQNSRANKAAAQKDAKDQELARQKEIQEKALGIANDALKMVRENEIDPEEGIRDVGRIRHLLAPEDRDRFGDEQFTISNKIQFDREQADIKRQDELSNRQRIQSNLDRTFNQSVARDNLARDKFNFKKSVDQVKKTQEETPSLTPASDALVKQTGRLLSQDDDFNELSDEDRINFSTIVANDVKEQQKNGVSFNDALSASKEKFKVFITEEKKKRSFLGINFGQKTVKDFNSNRTIETRIINGEAVTGFVSGDKFIEVIQ